MPNNFAANLKEVNDLIDADIEWAKELEAQKAAYDKAKRWKEEPCPSCGHAIHPHCNNANCEDKKCWVDGEDYFEDIGNEND